MTSEFKIVEEPKKTLSMNPKKFAMWLFIASVMMLFAAFTSAYVVRRAEGNWVFFELPKLFYTTSAIVILGSITMQLAYLAAKKDDEAKVKLWMILTAVLGVSFLVGQVFAWKQLVLNNIYLVGNPSGSFIYLLSGLHGFHLIGGLIFILIVLNAGAHFKWGWRYLLKSIMWGVSVLSIVVFLILALQKKHTLKVNSKNLAPIEMCATYWHFLGGLWLYLFVFLLLNR